MLHAEYPPFPGFTDAGLRFLRDLKANNDRAWFNERKATFEDEVLDPARCLAADFARQAPAAGLPLTGDPRRSLFRIYRDTRFSKDKRPYKDHVGIVLSRSGERNEEGVLYVHVAPGAAFIGAGYWHPEAPLLRRWRARMAADPEEWLGVVEDVRAAGLEVAAEDRLKRMPRGFEEHADGPLADWLKGKSFLVTRPVPDDLLRRPDLTKAVVETGQAALPLLAYGWDLLD